MTGNGRLPRIEPLHLTDHVRAAVQAAAFWIGVLLPLAYVPLLLFTESSRIDGFGLLARVVAINALACIVGHGYEP